MATPATARLTPTAPGRLVLTGELTFASVPGLWPQAAPLFSGQAGLEIDLSGVARADSAGLALLVAWQAQAAAVGCAVRYAQVPDRLQAIARISEVDSILAA